MLTEECLTEIGKLFKKAQYQKCEKSLHKCLSDFERNCGLTQNNVSCDDLRKTSSESESQNIASHCTAILRCIFQQNKNVCTFLCNNVSKKPSDEVKFAYERFSSLLQDIHGWAICEHHIDTELIILNNYLSILMGYHILEAQEWSEHAFVLISMVLNRAFEVRTGSVASVHRPVTEEIVSLIDGILLHTENMTEFALDSLSALCYTIFFLLIIHNVYLPVHYVMKIMSKLEQTCKRNRQQKRRQGFVCLYPSNLVTPGIPCHNDFLQLLLACSYMGIKDTLQTLSCLERITYLGWEHFIGYMKAFLLFKEKQYDQALETVWSLWKTKEKAENWMVSRLSNFIGCCLFEKGCYSMSLKWFQKSIKSDFTFHLPLWNIAVAFECLGKTDTSLAILENLEKVSSLGSHKDASYLFCNYLWFQNQSDITHVPALYLLAHQCLSSGCFSLSAKYFTKILHLLKEKPLEDLLHSVHFSISMLDIYVEASYAYLHAAMYDDCLETGKSVDEYLPASNFLKQSESSLNWNINKKLVKNSYFNQHMENSLQTGKLSYLCPLNDPNVDQAQGEGRPSIFCGRNEDDGIFLKSENCTTEIKVDNKDQCSHYHIKPYYVMHLMIEASAKYSLNCVSKTVDTLRRALSATTDYQEVEENASIGVPSQDQDPSIAKYSEESCPVCSNLISSLRSQIYNNFAVVSISKGNLREAAHNLRIAMMFDSDNIDAIYNYCVLQVKLEQTEVARSFWESSKLRCDKIKSILSSDDQITLCTVTVDQLKDLDEAFASNVPPL